jgi:hypothetical protein
MSATRKLNMITSILYGADETRLYSARRHAGEHDGGFTKKTREGGVDIHRPVTEKSISQWQSSCE